jgi:nucleotide-binding universal stress UspA family protein
MYKRILLAYDGSESGQNALLNCRDIAQWSHSELFLVAIMPPVINVAVDGAFYDGRSDAESESQRYQEILADGLKQLSDAGLCCYRRGASRGICRADCRLCRED